MFGFIRDLFRNDEHPEIPTLSKLEATRPDVLCGENPWGIYKKKSEKYGYVYGIAVFLLDKDDWTYLEDYSEAVIGVKQEEFKLIVRNNFKAEIYENTFCDELYVLWPVLEDAQKFLNEIKDYYDSFYTPRAVMNRLSCYIEGGYPPYFINHPVAQGIIKGEIRLPAKGKRTSIFDEEK